MRLKSSRASDQQLWKALCVDRGEAESTLQVRLQNQVLNIGYTKESRPPILFSKMSSVLRLCQRIKTCIT